MLNIYLKDFLDMGEWTLGNLPPPVITVNNVLDDDSD
jgi:hypothetical protein